MPLVHREDSIGIEPVCEDHDRGISQADAEVPVVLNQLEGGGDVFDPEGMGLIGPV